MLYMSLSPNMQQATLRISGILQSDQLFRRFPGILFICLLLSHPHYPLCLILVALVILLNFAMFRLSDSLVEFK